MTIEGMPTPRELSEMIVKAQYKKESDNINELVDELLVYMNPEFPRKTAELQIKAVIQDLEKKEELTEFRCYYKLYWRFQLHSIYLLIYLQYL